MRYATHGDNGHFEVPGFCRVEKPRLLDRAPVGESSWLVAYGMAFMPCLLPSRCRIDVCQICSAATHPRQNPGMTLSHKNMRNMPRRPSMYRQLPGCANDQRELNLVMIRAIGSTRLSTPNDKYTILYPLTAYNLKGTLIKRFLLYLSPAGMVIKDTRPEHPALICQRSYRTE
jgi:hypothetical protein